MASYKEYLTEKILKIFNNSDIIDPHESILINKIEDLNKINYTFYIFIYHLINYYHRYIDIFKFPKSKNIRTLDNLLNHIIYQSNYQNIYFNQLKEYESKKSIDFTDYLTSHGLSILLSPRHIQSSLNIYLEFYSLTFISIVQNPINLQQNLYNFNIFFKYDSLFKGIKFYILYQYLSLLYYGDKSRLVNIPNIIIVLDYFLDNDFFNISMINFNRSKYVLNNKKYIQKNFNSFFDLMFYIDPYLSNDFYYLEMKHRPSPDFNETFIGSIEHYKYEYLRYLSKLIYDYKKYSNYRFLWIKMVYVNLKHVSYFNSDEYKAKMHS